MREDVKGLVTRYQKTEDDLSALQSVGQIIGDVLKRLDNDRFIVKASSGPRYVVGCRSRLNHDKLKPGTRVALDMTTLTIMRILPREVDPTVFHMQSSEDEENEGSKKVSFSDIGGLNEQIRELREVIELPLTNPELFIRVGIKVSILFVWYVLIIYYTSLTSLFPNFSILIGTQRSSSLRTSWYRKNSIGKSSGV